MSTLAPHPLLRFPRSCVVMPLRLCGSVEHYAAVASAGSVAVDATARYNKRDKATHRMDICDTHGALKLTVPIAFPAEMPAEGGRLAWSDIVVSDHGHWWSIMLTALESAYGRTPFFPYYVDRFAPFFTARYTAGAIKLWELDRDLDAVICDILGVPTPTYVATAEELAKWNAEGEMAGNSAQPVSEVASTRQSPEAIPERRFPAVEYYQVRADRFGFMPSLSILDLIFNMGPEAPLVLKKMIDGCSPAQ